MSDMSLCFVEGKMSYTPQQLRDYDRSDTDAMLDWCADEIERLTTKLTRIIALTDTGSNEYRDAFDPERVGERPSGWRVVEKIRETILGV